MENKKNNFDENIEENESNCNNSKINETGAGKKSDNMGNAESKNNNKKRKPKFIPFWYRFFVSIADIDKYYLIALEGAKRSLKYIVLMTLILSIIITTAFVKENSKILNSTANYIKNNIIDFIITRDGLKFESTQKKIVIKLNRVNNPRIVISTETSDEENEKLVSDYNGKSILFGKNQIYINESMINEKIKYSDILEMLNMDEIKKDDVLGLYNDKNLIKNVYIVMSISVFIYLFLEGLITLLMYVIAISLVAKIVSRMFGMKFKYSALFSMATAALTFPVLLAVIYALLFIFTGFEIKYFTVMLTLIAYVYIVSALINIYRNLVKISGN